MYPQRRTKKWHVDAYPLQSLQAPSQQPPLAVPLTAWGAPRGPLISVARYPPRDMVSAGPSSRRKLPPRLLRNLPSNVPTQRYLGQALEPRNQRILMWGYWVKWTSMTQYCRRRKKCAKLTLVTSSVLRRRYFSMLSKYRCWHKRHTVQHKLLLYMRCEATLRIMRRYYHTLTFLPNRARLRLMAHNLGKASQKEFHRIRFKRWVARALWKRELPRRMKHIEWIYSRNTHWLILLRFRLWVRWLSVRRWLHSQNERVQPLLQRSTFRLLHRSFSKWSLWRHKPKVRRQQRVRAVELSRATLKTLTLRYFSRFQKYVVRSRARNVTVFFLEQRALRMLVSSYWQRWASKAKTLAVKALCHKNERVLLARYYLSKLQRAPQWAQTMRVSRHMVMYMMSLYALQVRRMYFAKLRRYTLVRMRRTHSCREVVLLEQRLFLGLVAGYFLSWLQWLKKRRRPWRRYRRSGVLDSMVLETVRGMEQRVFTQMARKYMKKWRD